MPPTAGYKLVLGAAFLLTGCLLVWLSEFQARVVSAAASSSSSSSGGAEMPLPAVASAGATLELLTPNVSCAFLPNLNTIDVLLGIMSTAEHADRRAWIRRTYFTCPEISAGSIVPYFVIGLSGRSAAVPYALWREQQMLGDLIVLDMPENMNDGKTYEFFKMAAGCFPRARYAIKADDDSLVRTSALVRALREPDMPDERLYWGVVMTATAQLDTGPFPYVGGMAEVLSRDLVHWIATDAIPREHRRGYEDLMVGWWFKKANLAVNVRSDERFHDVLFGGNLRPASNQSIVMHHLQAGPDFVEHFDRWGCG